LKISTLRQAWNPKGSLVNMNVGENTFLHVFNRERDLDHVFSKISWAFDRQLMLMKWFHRDAPTLEVCFGKVPFWIQVSNISIKSMTYAVGARIGKEIGDLLDVNAPRGGVNWGRFLSIKVAIYLERLMLSGK
jgi:hypothetical protein